MNETAHTPTRTVYVVVVSYGYDGYGTPKCAFSTERAALDYVSSGAMGSYRHDTEIWEISVDDPSVAAREAAGQGEAGDAAVAELWDHLVDGGWQPPRVANGTLTDWIEKRSATPREASDAPDIVSKAAAEIMGLDHIAHRLDEQQQDETHGYVQEIVADALAALRAELAAVTRERDEARANHEYFATQWDDRGYALKAADAEVAGLKDENAALKEALVAHNDLLRGAFGAAQRDAIHEVIGTTNYNLLANAIQKVLFKYHAITNDARSLTAAKGG